MDWPQWVYLTLLAISTTFRIVNDGKPAGKHNAVVAVFYACLALGLLYAGGFFS